MKNSEIKGLSIEEIKEKISSSEKSLQSLKFANAISPIENPLQIKDVRKFIARLKTELHNRVVTEVAEKVKSGELTNFNAREFLSKTKLDSPLNLTKIKKILAGSKN
ncbi:MAG: 50S ribosomal protein L29 [Flammeovirgaceae bacterium]|nr:50S ribosomal protein L29 [Flammeovirgaceae bacterium]